MLEFLSALRDIVVALGPILAAVTKMLSDAEGRKLTKGVTDAKTLDEKRLAASAVAEFLHKRSS
jgi:MoxR-like ATPase